MVQHHILWSGGIKDVWLLLFVMSKINNKGV
jgi:hypothetical protein